MAQTVEGAIESTRERLPYKQSAVALVIDGAGNAFLVQKADHQDNEWDIPGGGVEEGETAKDGLFRELSEEMGVGADSFEILAKSALRYGYDWTPETILRKEQEKGKRWRGQQRTQYLVRFRGDTSAVTIRRPELRNGQWVPINALASYLVLPGQWENMERLEDEWRAYLTPSVTISEQVEE